jgi:hypothetical protein
MSSENSHSAVGGRNLFAAEREFVGVNGGTVCGI